MATADPELLDGADELLRLLDELELLEVELPEEADLLVLELGRDEALCSLVDVAWADPGRL